MQASGMERLFDIRLQNENWAQWQDRLECREPGQLINTLDAYGIAILHNLIHRNCDVEWIQ